jgi:hypothetical protein
MAAQDDKVIIIYDKFPKAKVHLLLLPKEPLLGPGMTFCRFWCQCVCVCCSVCVRVCVYMYVGVWTWVWEGGWVGGWVWVVVRVGACVRACIYVIIMCTYDGEASLRAREKGKEICKERKPVFLHYSYVFPSR